MAIEMPWYVTEGAPILIDVFQKIKTKFFDGKKKYSEDELKKIIETSYPVRLLQEQNAALKKEIELIFLIMIKMFSENNNGIHIENNDNVYIINSALGKMDFEINATKTIESELNSYVSKKPKSLAEAVWPIPEEWKDDLYAELENACNDGN